jgi:hypothetical protein
MDQLTVTVGKVYATGLTGFRLMGQHAGSGFVTGWLHSLRGVETGTAFRLEGGSLTDDAAGFILEL